MSLATVISLAVLVFLVCFFVFLVGLRFIRENQVGVIVKRIGTGKLPDGRVVALSGEPGYQAHTLAPGIHFYPRILYKIEKHPITVIQPGQVGIVMANDGDMIPVNRILGKNVDSDNFQSAEKFLRNGGQKGKQSVVLTAGFYRINPIVFKVQTVPVTKIDSDKVGILTVLDGHPIIAGELAGPVISGHESFQRPDVFIANGGCRGLQEQIILAGTYNLNPWFVEVEEHPLFEVPIGHVGVVVSFVGENKADISGEKFTHGNIVPRGGKGVWETPLYPGKHPVNTRCMKLELVPTTNIVLNWASARTEAHKLDEKLSTISVRSNDGFMFNLDVSQIINIGATRAPWVISRVGSVRNLVNQVLEPIIGNYFRNSAQHYTVLDFLSNRAERQREARSHINEAVREYDVQSVDTLIGDITPPQELMATLTARKMAEEKQKTFGVEQQTEVTRQELEKQRALANKQSELVNAEQDVVIAERRANSAVKTAQGDSDAQARRAEGEALAKRRIGEAEATVVAIKGENEAKALRAIGDAKAEAYRKGVEAMGGDFGRLQIASVLAEKGIRITPDVVVSSSGANGSASAADGILALLLRDTIQNDHKK